jgi:TolB-like protein
MILYSLRISIIGCIFIILIFSCKQLYANEEVYQLEVLGEGVSYRDALTNALTNGVSQVYGFKLKSEEIRKTEDTDINTYIDGHTQSLGEINVSSSGKIDFQTEGFVQSYEVLSKAINASNLYEITALVTIKKYKNPGISPHTRRKIAVLPFHVYSKSQDGVYSQYALSQAFNQHLVTQLTQCRKFTVLDRDYVGAYLDEQKLIKSTHVHLREQIKLGQVLGTDYLLVGTIISSDILQKQFYNNIVGAKGFNYRAIFIADYRILVMATRQVKWANTIRMTLEDQDIKNILSDPTIEQIQQIMFESASKHLVQHALENIYPLQIVEIQSDGLIILNQGGETIIPGDKFDVFKPGEKLIDPYTKESLGAAETWVATILIDRVNPKISYARLINGEYSLISKGHICRRCLPESVSHRNQTGRKTDIKITPGGGVILPGDPID